MKNSTFILKQALIYFVAFLICFGPIAGYIFALKKYERFIMFDTVIPPEAEKQKANSLPIVNSNPRPIAQKCISDDRLKEAIQAFSVLPVSKDGRIEVTREVLNNLFIEQKEVPTLFTNEWNESTSTEWVPYSNPELGIVSMSIPYNPAWGNKVFKIKPYEIKESSNSSKTGTSIYFGKVGTLTKVEWGNNWSNGYSLVIMPHEDANEIKSAKMGARLLFEDGANVENINGHDVVYGKKWMDYPAVVPIVYEIVGSKYNYQLYPGLYSSYDEATMRKIVEKIVVE